MEGFVDVCEAEFDTLVFDNVQPSLVLFGAARCSVCKELAPVVQQVVSQSEGRITLYWADVDNNKQLIQRFRIKGIPSVMMFKNGAMVGRLGGLQTKADVEMFLNSHIQ